VPRWSRPAARWNGSRNQSESDKSRVDTLARTKELAQAEFERVRGLFEESQVGTRSNVEKAETAFNQARDALDLLRQNVSLYPFRIQEQAEALALAEASLEKAALSLERTEVRAEFTARVKEKKVEVGQYVAPARRCSPWPTTRCWSWRCAPGQPRRRRLAGL
jgi:multidrug resistance efflux pump